MLSESYLLFRYCAPNYRASCIWDSLHRGALWNIEWVGVQATNQDIPTLFCQVYDLLMYTGIALPVHWTNGFKWLLNQRGMGQGLQKKTEYLWVYFINKHIYIYIAVFVWWLEVNKCAFTFSSEIRQIQCTRTEFWCVQCPRPVGLSAFDKHQIQASALDLSYFTSKSKCKFINLIHTRQKQNHLLMFVKNYK